MAMPDALLLFGGEVSPSDRGHAGAGGFAGDLLAIDPLDGALQELVRVRARVRVRVRV